MTNGPVTAGVVVTLFEKFQEELAGAIDAHVTLHGVPAPAKTPADPNVLSAWKSFPRSCGFYTQSLERIGKVGSAMRCQQSLVELVLQWRPPTTGGE